MKVLHITNLYPSKERPDYGIFIEEQITSLRDADISCEVYKIDVERYGVLAYLKAVIELLLFHRNYDVYHAHHILSGFVTIIAKPLRRKIVSFLSSGYDIEPNSKLSCLAPFLYWFVCTYSDMLITKVKKISLTNKKFKYIPNGVNGDLFSHSPKSSARKKLGIDSTALVPLFVCSKSLKRREKRKDLFDKLTNKLNLNGINTYPLIVNNISRNKIPLFYNAADIHILLSDYEGSPNSIKESLSCGCPVLATNVGDISEILEGIPNTKIINQSETTNDETLSFVLSCQNLEAKSRKKISDKFIEKKLSQRNIALKISKLYGELC